MTEPNHEGIARPTARFPPPDMSHADFEEFVVELLGCTSELVTDLRVTLHDKIEAADGTYDFDATVRFTFGGMSFVVLVEAKKHKNPIKRELVQVLHQKLQSVGAQKAAMVSTAPYQSGALQFAVQHGIALVTVTEGRFILETRSRDDLPVLTREEGATLFGLPPFVGHAYTGTETGGISVTLMSTEYPEYVVERIFGVESQQV